MSARQMPAATADPNAARAGPPKPRDGARRSGRRWHAVPPSRAAVPDPGVSRFRQADCVRPGGRTLRSSVDSAGASPPLKQQASILGGPIGPRTRPLPRPDSESHRNRQAGRADMPHTSTCVKLQDLSQERGDPSWMPATPTACHIVQRALQDTPASGGRGTYVWRETRACERQHRRELKERMPTHLRQLIRVRPPPRRPAACRPPSRHRCRRPPGQGLVQPG